MSAPSPRAAQLAIASAFIKHARANHPAPFGECRNPECWRGYRLLMRLWPDVLSLFTSFVGDESKNARFEIAHKVSNALPLTCWIDWAGWALGLHPIQENSHASNCGSDDFFSKHRCCYCGKHTTPEFLAEIAAEREKEQAQCQ